MTPEDAKIRVLQIAVLNDCGLWLEDDEMRDAFAQGGTREAVIRIGREISDGIGAQKETRHERRNHPIR